MDNKNNNGEAKASRAHVTLPHAVWEVLDEHYKNEIGVADAEIIRNLLIIYMTERGQLPQCLEGRP